MANEVPLNLNTYSTTFYLEMITYYFMGVGLFDGPKFPGSKSFPNPCRQPYHKRVNAKP